MNDLITLILALLLFLIINAYNFFVRKKQPQEQPEVKKNVEKEVPVRRPPSHKAVRPKPAYVPRTVQDSFSFKTKMSEYSSQSSIDAHTLHTAVEQRNLGEQISDDVVSRDMAMEDHLHAYDIVHQEGNSRVRDLLTGFSDKQKMILIHEVFSPPKGLRTPFQ